MVLDVLYSTEWDNLITGKKISAVTFWAPWSASCISFKPIFESISKGFQNVYFARVNVDEQSDISEKYGIKSIPIIKFFCESMEIDEIVGYVPKNVLQEKIYEIIKNTHNCLSTISISK